MNKKIEWLCMKNMKIKNKNYFVFNNIYFIKIIIFQKHFFYKLKKN